MKQNGTLFSYALLLSIPALLLVRFGAVLINPNGYLFVEGGDGLKNYYLFSYYLRHDDGLRFTGINYPYGEHLFFLDSHPLLALFLNTIEPLFPLADFAPGLINLAILSGALVGSGLLYVLLLKIGLRGWFATVAVFCITFLSPQWDRLGGHLSLSYLFVIPGILLLILRWHEQRNVSRATQCGLFVFITGGLHPYFLPMHLLLVFGYLFFDWLVERRWNWRQHIPMLLAGLLPLIIFQFWQNRSDSVSDRPAEVYGFFTYKASLGSILMPHYKWAESLPYLLFKDNIQWEGRAYLGLPIALLLVLGIYRMVRSRRVFFEDLGERLPRAWLFLLGSSVLMLIFSMCIPFRFGMHWLVDILSPLKQIRALGRFVWPFYYVAGLTGAYLIYGQLVEMKSTKGRFWRNALVYLVIIFWVFESARFFLQTTQGFINPNATLIETDILSFEGIDSHQAILALPLAVTGTDKLSIHHEVRAMEAAYAISLQSGIPIIETMTARPSLKQSLSAIQMISDPLITKTRLADMDERPLLTVTVAGAALRPHERVLLDSSYPLASLDGVQLSSLPVSSIRQVTENARKNFHPSPNASYRWFDYDSLVAEVSMTGPGALHISSTSGTVLQQPNQLADRLSLSFWVYIDPRHQPMPEFTLETSGHGIWTEVGSAQSWNQTNVWRQWVMIEFEFDCSIEESFRLKSSRSAFIMDNLLIRPADQNILLEQRPFLWHNNFPVHLE